MAIRAGLDLAKLIPWLGALILATLAYYIVQPFVAALDVSIAGLHPFRFVGNALETGIVEPLNDLRQRSDAEVAKGLSSLVDNLAIAVGLVLVLGILVKAALQYLWNHALRPLIHSITDTIRETAANALAKATGLEGTIAHDVAALAGSIAQEADTTFARARTYADTAALNAEHAAERYADEAVSALRAAEDAAVDNVASLARSAAAAGALAANAALSEAEAFTVRAVAEADATFDAALTQAQAIAIGAEHDLGAFKDYIDSLGLAGLVAAVPALALLVSTIAAESGLDSSACRAKNKQICGVDPAAWEGLLVGLAALGFAFSLSDLADVARSIIGELEPVIAQAA